ncbi:hypothetical protein, conserved [Angomonas deanei]|uniref:Uncharacterized protein n=1 Tax=Angomonas deanei TaxID=59799 RepID=A0A7G2CTW8_9TRYP|nr:hypothetical protein, conserved [Angomonas deanei]
MDTEPPNPQEREKKRTLMTKFVRWGEALRHSPLDGFAHLFSLRTTVLNYLRGTVLSPHYSTMIGPLLRFQSPAMGGDFQQQQQQLLELVRGALLNGEDGWGAHPLVYTLLGRCDSFIWPTGTALFLPGRDRRSMLTLKHRVITRVTGVDRVEE